MKTEKTMKVKSITMVSIVVAIAVAAITLLSVFLPKHMTAQAATKDIKPSQAEQVIGQIDSLQEEYQKSFDEHAELWEKYFAEIQKLDELPEDFDEKAFIGSIATLRGRR